MSSSRHRLMRWIALFTFSAIITLTMQTWVGATTIYSEELQPRRERLHELILHNAPPSTEDWVLLGANSTNIRIGAVYLAEAVHQVTGLTLARSYRLIDTVALFIAIPLLLRFCLRYAPLDRALLATLYVTSILPLTYVLHYFHPWDRIMLIFWIIMIELVQNDRRWLLAAALVASMVVKFDALFLPALYFLVHARRQTLLPVAVRTAALFAVTFGSYFALRALFPGGSQVGHVSLQVSINLDEIGMYNISYPPMLGFAVPVFLTAVGWRSATRFARACVVFALGLSVIYFLNSNFAELRAMMPVMLLLIPCALTGLSVLMPAAQHHSPAPEAVAR